MSYYFGLNVSYDSFYLRGINLARKSTNRKTSAKISEEPKTKAPNGPKSASPNGSRQNSTAAPKTKSAAPKTDSVAPKTDSAAATTADSTGTSFTEQLKDKKGLLTSLFYGIAVLLSAVIAYYIRTIPKDNVFMSNGFIRLDENDPWYHWNNVNYLLHNFPNVKWFDPATTYPYGTSQAFAPLYDIVIATVIKILQAITGNTSTEFAMTIFAYWPCVFAGFCVIALYFAAKKIFNSRPIGLFSAFLLAIAPGQFLHRSIIGFSDHHVAEVFFSTIVIYFLVLTLLKAKKRVVSNDEIFKGKLSGFKSLLPYAVLTGLAMATYTLVWEGALLFAFVIGVFITVQLIINHLKGEETAFYAVIGILIFAVDLLIIVAIPQIGEYKILHIIALSAGIAAMAAMAVLAYVMDKKSLDKVYFPASMIGVGAIAIVVGSFVSTTIKNVFLSVAGFFTRTGGALTIGEASPFFNPITPEVFIVFLAIYIFLIIALATSYIKENATKKALLIGWTALFAIVVLVGGERIYSTFAYMGYLWLFALPMLTYSAIRNNNKEKMLFVIWTVVLVWAMAQQNRFSYYFVVPVVIMTSYLFMELAKAVKLDEAWDYIKKSLTGKKDEPTSKYSRNDDKALKALAAVAILVIAATVIVYPTYDKMTDYTQSSGGINDAWLDACLWLRDNTPVPGLDPLGHYVKPLQDADGDGVADTVSGIGIEYFENQVSIVPFDYPEPAYGVMSWWDYGHWIQVVGERMPNANPFQFGVGGRRGDVSDPMIPGSSPFFVAETEEYATQILYDIDPREGKYGAKYIITDIEMASGAMKFGAMVKWTLDDVGYGVVIPYNDGDRMVYGSERYFNSMVARLHLFDTSGLEQYRMIYESEVLYTSYAQWTEQEFKSIYNFVYGTDISTDLTGYVKIFEFVSGATLQGTASPGETVNLLLEVQTNQGRTFTYTQSATADSSGQYTMRVPYSTTDNSNLVVKPTGPYTIMSGGIEKTVNVSEADILNGRTVTVP